MYNIRTDIKLNSVNLDIPFGKPQQIADVKTTSSIEQLKTYIYNNISFQSMLAKFDKYPSYQEFIKYKSLSDDPYFELDILCCLFKCVTRFSKDENVFVYGISYPTDMLSSIWAEMILGQQINPLLQYFTYPSFHQHVIYDDDYICYELKDDVKFSKDNKFVEFYNDPFIKCILDRASVTNLPAIDVSAWSIEQVLGSENIRFLKHCVDHLYFVVLKLGEGKFSAQLRWYFDE